MAKSVFVDLLAGFAALGVVMAGFVTGVLGQNLRTQIILVCALFLVAGVIRGALVPSNPWIKGLLVGLGSGVPVCIMAAMRMAFTSKPHLVVFLASSLLAAVAGAHIRRFWILAHRRAALAVAGALAVATILTAQLLIPIMLEKLSTRRVEQRAPAFSFSAVNGGRVSNESLRGRVAVLAFWATWCAPCREELPRLDQLYKRYNSNPSVAFFAVDTEGEKDSQLSARKAQAFFTKTGLSLPLVVSEGDASRNLGVSSLPALLIIDQRGCIRVVHAGYDGAENLESIVGGEITALLRSGGL
jgi:thiol-disulfide isomerase/thioredoxin